MSARWVNAVIATEDSRFFEHRGVDFVGIVRAVLANVNFRRLWISQVVLTLGGSLMQMGFIELFRSHHYDPQVETAKFSHLEPAKRVTE